MRIIFAGTPDFAAAHLRQLIAANLNVVGVYSQPDRPSGRGKKLTASAVKQVALDHKLSVEQPQNFKDEITLRTLNDFQPDLMIVVAYGLILPKAVLDIPKYGCVNVHGSILPRWRGAAPIQRSIWAGDTETGITIMQMDEGLDTGAILSQESITIARDETSSSLYEKLAQIGPSLLVNTILDYQKISPQVQDNAKATYAKKLSKEEAKINWQEPAKQLDRNIRAFNPWPIAWMSINDLNIKVWEAEYLNQQAQVGKVVSYNRSGLDIGCAEGVLRITKLQLPNKKPQSIADIINGNPLLVAVGDVLH